MSKLGLAVVLALSCAGCGKAPEKPMADTPEEVFRKFVNTYIAVDGKAQWAMLSERQRKQSEAALAEIKASPDEKLGDLAAQLNATLAEIRAAKPEEFTTMVMRSRMKEPGALARTRSYGQPKVTTEGKRLHVLAKTPDDRFTWSLWLVEEAAQWKVDEENEEEEELKVIKPGEEK
ncbi:MAG: hypothetical protein FD180_633 [Planctomycetota bacterium]|nr:MAG: hypothetical protein FD180_633 [Planctomycetota bacterium]